MIICGLSLSKISLFTQVFFSGTVGDPWANVSSFTARAPLAKICSTTKFRLGGFTAFDENENQGEANHSSTSNGEGSSSANVVNANNETSEEKMKKALQDITSLYYNEERNEIYAGNADGKLMVWSN